LKKVGLTPDNDNANPANATIASSTSSLLNCLNKNSTDFNAANLPLKNLISFFNSSELISYSIFGLPLTLAFILFLRSLIPFINCCSSKSISSEVKL